MSSMLIAANMTRDNGQFMGDQLCGLKTAYCFVQNRPKDVDKILIALSPSNEMHFLWQKFIDCPGEGLPPCDVIYDTFNPGDNEERWLYWNKWRTERHIEGRSFEHYREFYLRIHSHRQVAICGYERGLERRNIYEWWLYGQEDQSESYSGTDWFDDTLIYHPTLTKERDVYISPHCKTQGNVTFTFGFWSLVVRRLIAHGFTVTVGYDNSAGPFDDEAVRHNPLYRRFWGTFKQWQEEMCKHKIVACGNTGTGWLAAACGIPMITMEPHNSIMADHRFRECGLRNIIEVVDGYKLDSLNNDMPRVADYVANRIMEQLGYCLVMTTGCYDILHAGHIQHLRKSRSLGTKLIVAMNSDSSVKRLKGDSRPINTQDQRKSVLEALRSVDEVVIFDEDTALHLYEQYKPSIVTNGFGYTEDRIVGKVFVESWGGRAVVTCEGDASTEPSTTKVLQKAKAIDVAEVIRLGSLYSVNSRDKLELLAKELQSVLHLDGDIADLGAYKGGTSIIMRRIAPDKCLHIFDTWTGNPFDDPLCHHKVGEWAASLDDCKKLVGDAYYHQGILPDSALGKSALYCFVYVDVDTYRTTCDAIDYFWPLLVSGGKLVIDDYDWEPCAGIKKAVDESGLTFVHYPQQYTVVVTK